MKDEALLNNGFFVSGVAPAGKALDAGKPTLIVTGIARSGTSLIATLLKQAGVYLGEFLDDVVNEDALLHALLRGRDMPALKDLIQARNAEHAQWGFKIPTLHAFLKHSDLALFRNPHLIVIFRDPVAVAVRNARSEHFGELDNMLDTASAMYGLARFAHRAECRKLMLSYEKVLSRPATAIAQLLEFCGIKMDGAGQAGLLRHVQPDRAEYLAAARTTFEGWIEGVLNGHLYGWCRRVNSLEPVRLELYADDRLVETMVANAFRGDLAQASVGNGCHGFEVDLTRQGLDGNAVIRVKVGDRVLELRNSGKRLSELPHSVTDPAMHGDAVHVE
jgi:hypothetical protein